MAELNETVEVNDNANTEAPTSVQEEDVNAKHEKSTGEQKPGKVVEQEPEQKQESKPTRRQERKTEYKQEYKQERKQEPVEDPATEELRLLKEEITQMAIAAAIKEAQLPDTFANLVPRDSLVAAKSFLESDSFKQLVDEYRDLQSTKASLAEELEATKSKLEKPIPKENPTTVPTSVTSPTEKPAVTKWGDFDDSFYQQLGASFKLF